MEMRNPTSMPIGIQHFAQLIARIDALEKQVQALQNVSPAYVELTEVTTPNAGPVNTGRLFTVDNGAGKTSLRVRFNTGAVQTIATEP